MCADGSVMKGVPRKKSGGRNVAGVGELHQSERMNERYGEQLAIVHEWMLDVYSDNLLVLRLSLLEVQQHWCLIGSVFGLTDFLSFCYIYEASQNHETYKPNLLHACPFLSVLSYCPL